MDLNEIKNMLSQRWLLDGDDLEKKFEKLAEILLKVDSILTNNYYGSDIEKDSLIDGFNKHLKSEYRFHI